MRREKEREREGEGDVGSQVCEGRQIETARKKRRKKDEKKEGEKKQRHGGWEAVFLVGGDMGDMREWAISVVSTTQALIQH